MAKCSTLTETQVPLLVMFEIGLVYYFVTTKLNHLVTWLKSNNLI